MAQHATSMPLASWPTISSHEKSPKLSNCIACNDHEGLEMAFVIAATGLTNGNDRAFAEMFAQNRGKHGRQTCWNSSNNCLHIFSLD